jgi:hypothetical protein
MRFVTFVRLATLSIALAAGPALATPLSAGDQVEVGNQEGNAFTPSPQASDPNGLYVSLGFILDAGTEAERSVGAAAGLFVLDYRHDSTDTWTRFFAFCLQPNVYLMPFSNPYAVDALAETGYDMAGIAELWGRHYGDIDTDLEAAAFQVALWELSYGDRDGNLATGSFRLSSTTSNTFSLAQQWLDGLDGNGPMASGLLVLTDTTADAYDRQDLITQVPEPASVALFGLALAGLGFVRRRH